MIAIDWGTTNLRAFRIRAGTIVDRAQGPGLTSPGTSTSQDFPATLHATIAPWLEQGERHVLMCGMVGSRQGWVEAPYLPCPADTRDLAAAAIRVPFEGADIRLIPGLSAIDPSGTPEVMRGEEVQIAGVLHQLGPHATLCLPGTHSKWARIVARRVDGFTTHMTGEAFAALRHHTILSRLIGTDAPHHPASFGRGVDHSADPGGLLHHLFGVRTLGLFDQLPPEHAASFLSGLLIGHEIRAAAPGTPTHLIGAPALTTLYAAAIEQVGGTAIILNEDAAAAGLWRLSEHIAWT